MYPFIQKLKFWSIELLQSPFSEHVVVYAPLQYAYSRLENLTFTLEELVIHCIFLKKKTHTYSLASDNSTYKGKGNKMHCEEYFMIKILSVMPNDFTILTL